MLGEANVHQAVIPQQNTCLGILQPCQRMSTQHLGHFKSYGGENGCILLASLEEMIVRAFMTCVLVRHANIFILFYSNIITSCCWWSLNCCISAYLIENFAYKRGHTLNELPDWEGTIAGLVLLGAHHLRGGAQDSGFNGLYNQLSAFVRLRYENEHWVSLAQLGLHITDSDSRRSGTFRLR